MNRQLKTSATKLLALSAACLAQPSYSDVTYGYTNNAAAGGLNWSMSQPVLGVAPVPGVDITGVIYRYTAVKDRADPFTVSVQNENAIDGGYIFRETDDWSGKSGQTINKLVPVGYSPIKYWGDGEIATTGVGSVEDPTVLYTYRFDTCFDPQNDPNCPGYEPPLPPPQPEIEVYSAVDDPYAQTAVTDPDLYEKDDDESKDKDSGEDEDKRLEKALAASDNALTLANGVSQSSLVQAMNIATNLNTYYSANIPGGAYKDAPMLKDKNLPDNRRAFRSMAQQRLHTEMVEEQYR